LLFVCLCGVESSPFETHQVIENFHESVEMIAGFPSGNDFHIIKNGDQLSESMTKFEPLIGNICGASNKLNYSLVAVDIDDLGHQRVLYIIGNIPGSYKEYGGVIKLPYIYPAPDAGITHVLVLFEMKNYIPTWFPGNCTLLDGMKLVPNPDCQPSFHNCTKNKYVDAPECVAWAQLPNPEDRDDFEVAKFSKANNLTAVDILWFKTKSTSTTPAVSLTASTVAWWKSPVQSSPSRKTAKQLIERKIGVGECSESPKFHKAENNVKETSSQPATLIQSLIPDSTVAPLVANLSSTTNSSCNTPLRIVDTNEIE